MPGSVSKRKIKKDQDLFTWSNNQFKKFFLYRAALAMSANKARK